MRILVTGSAGFVGKSVGQYAVQAGHTVAGVARRSQPDLDWPGTHLALDVATADLAGPVADADPDVIFHAAGSASVGGSVAAPLDDFRAAVLSWINLLDGVRRSGRRPLIVFPSSAAVYGNPASLPVAESASIVPISPYGFHKAACELIAEEYASCFGLDILIVRVFSVFGPAQRRLLIWDIYRRAAGDEPAIWLEGTGRESRDFLHVDDLAALVLRLSADGAGRTGRSRVVNAGRGDESSVLTVAEFVRSAAGVDKPIRCRGVERPGDPQRWQADVRRLRETVPDWRPQPLVDAIDGCIAKWRLTRPDHRSGSTP